MEAPQLTLYSYWRSSSSYRVRAALELKGLAYQQRAVHLVEGGGQQHAEVYQALNPMRQVPTLVIEGEGRPPIVQSVAICELLEERFPTPPLLPVDPWERAQVRALVELINSGIQPIANLSVLKHLQSLGHDEAARSAWVGHWIRQGFSALEATLARTAGRFAWGDTPTLADCFLVPQVYNARRYAVDLAPYPLIAKVEAACLELGAFQRASPERQPDAPGPA